MLNRDTPATSLSARLQAIADWFERCGIDLEELVNVGDIRRLQGGTHQTAIKIKDPETGEETIEYATQERASWVIAPSWETGPQWPLPQPGPEFKIKHRKPKPASPDGWRSIVCLPDIQEPFGDDAAVQVAVDIVSEVRPDVIVLHGDNLDLAELSRFRQQPSFAGGAQIAIDRMTLLCAELRQSVGPDAEIVWLAGNHEERLKNVLLDNAAAAFGIRPGRMPEEDAQRPVLSVPALCRLEESGVTYLDGYPANAYWFQPNVRVVHGHYTGQQAARKYLAEGVTTIYGHTHHREWVERVLADGRLIHAISAGCLCSVDGSVPGTMAGYADDGSGPKRHPVNWQQGLLVGYGDGESFCPEMVPIRDGRAMWRGNVYG